MPTVYEHIAQNKRRTVLLVLLFPIAFALFTWAMLYLGIQFLDSQVSSAGTVYSVETASTEITQLSTQLNGWMLKLVPLCWLAAMVWVLVSYYCGDQLILSGAGAIPIEKRDQPEIYRLVENLCITRGLPLPKIYILDDDSLNAFATGRDPEHASIALTKGIIQKLDRVELEGVIAHELAHVENRDIRLMLITVAGISFFTLMAEILFRVGYSIGRSSSRSSRNGNSAAGLSLICFFIGFIFMIYGYVIAPLIRLAVSRTREYQADATAALTTRNPGALAAALRKISGDARVEALDKRESMAAMCIANPLSKAGIFSSLSGLLATHPPIESRIAALREMDGRIE